MIGDDVKITIVDVRGDKVRLGITAPKEIPVHRIEVYEAIQREKSEKQPQEREKNEKSETQAQEQEKSEKRAEAK
jgi:carbon storage regulator